MQFSFSFYIHFLASFIGYLFLGIYLCRGTWRNWLRAPLQIGIGFVLLGHLIGSSGPFSLVGKLVLLGMSFGSYFLKQRNASYVPSVERDGHNFFSLLVGAALFALTVQLHFVLFGVPVYQLVK